MFGNRRHQATLTALCLSITLAFPVFAAYGDGLLRNLSTKETLSNGLILIYQQDDSSATSVLQILMLGGKRREPKGKEGVAFLTTRLCLDLPDQQLLQQLMNQATNRTFICRPDFSLIKISCLSANLEEAVKLTAQILADPLISSVRIERIKEFMNHYRKLQDDEPINAAHSAATDNLFFGSAYAGPVYGTERSLKGIKKKDVENYYNACVAGSNMIVVISTDLEKEQTMSMVRPYFEKLPHGERSEAPPVSFTPAEESSLSLEKDAQQTLVYTAFPLPGISKKNYILSTMLENLLGKGMNSRLWSLRTEQKLAYIVNSRAFLMKDGGILEAYLETDQTKKDRAAEELDKTLRDLYRNGISAEELGITKVQSKGTVLRENETKDEKTYNLAYLEALGLGHDFLNGLLAEIDAITQEEFNAFIRDVLNPEKAVTITVGPSR